MENSPKILLNYFVGFIEATFAEGYIVLFLIGLLILLIGLFFIVATLVPIMFGAPSIKGVVAGAIRPDIKRTLIDQEVTTKKGMLFPVFQYTQENGALAFIRGSSGGTHVHKYKTGQHVNLIINEDSIFREKGSATDKGDMTGLYWGFSLLAIGSGLIYWAASVLSGLSLGFTTLIVIALSFMLRHKHKIKEGKVKQEKVFDFSEMKPVEEFTRN